MFILDPPPPTSSIMRAILVGSTLLGLSTSINLRTRARTEPPTLHHVGTLSPILKPTQRQCLGETYPSDDDGCGVCICATAEFENKLLDGGVDEYAEAATDDSSTWALPQRMEERCLRYLHSLSTGQDTFFIEKIMLNRGFFLDRLNLNFLKFRMIFFLLP